MSALSKVVFLKTQISLDRTTGALRLVIQAIADLRATKSLPVRLGLMFVGEFKVLMENAG